MFFQTSSLPKSARTSVNNAMKYGTYGAPLCRTLFLHCLAPRIGLRRPFHEIHRYSLAVASRAMISLFHIPMGHAASQGHRVGEGAPIQLYWEDVRQEILHLTGQYPWELMLDHLPPYTGEWPVRFPPNDITEMPKKLKRSVQPSIRRGLLPRYSSFGAYLAKRMAPLCASTALPPRWG